MKHGESDPRTVLFFDLLGFAALTEAGWNVAEPQLFDTRPIADDAATTFKRFHLALDDALAAHGRMSPAKAMIFSDCGFIVKAEDESTGTLWFAADLMRRFLLARVPVRMGIGFGSFDGLRFSSDTAGDVILNRSMFGGTGVVRANAAESKGGKGMRIFLHPSMELEPGGLNPIAPILPLSEPSPYAKWELDYLHPEIDRGDHPGYIVPDREDSQLFSVVNSMRPAGATADVDIQYSDTLLAINRMRSARGRISFSLNRDWAIAD
jgi:hypothetical protein